MIRWPIVGDGNLFEDLPDLGVALFRKEETGALEEAEIGKREAG